MCVLQVSRERKFGGLPDFNDYDRHKTFGEPFYKGQPIKIAPLLIDKDTTTVSDGDVSAITYRLNQSSDTDFFVNSDTGVIFGQFNTTSTPDEPFTMDLVVVDAAGQTAILEMYSFSVEVEPVILNFELQTKGAAPRTNVGPAFVDYRGGTSIEYFVGSSYKIAPLQISPAGTKVSEGSIDDITYRLNQSSTTDLFVNSDTGVVFGEFASTSPEDEPFLVELVAIDAAGRTAVVETYAFNVREVKRVVFVTKPVTKPDGTKPRTMVGGDYADYGNDASKYYSGASYMIAPRRIDPSPNVTEVSAGDIADITYRLDQSNETAFFVNSNTGVVFGKFTAASAAGKNFSMQLFAVDAGGQDALLETYTFPVLRCRIDDNEVWLDGSCQKCAPGSVPLETDPTQCRLEELAVCGNDAAKGAAHGINRCTCASPPNLLASCTCTPLDALAGAVHVHCTGARAVPDVLPLQTTQLRLEKLGGDAQAVALMQASAALGASGGEGARKIVVILDTDSVPDKPEPSTETSASSSATLGGGKTSGVLVSASTSNDTELCVGSGDTKTPSRVQTVVCNEKAGCGSDGTGAATRSNSSSSSSSYADQVCPKGEFAAPDGSGCMACDKGGFFLNESGKMGWFSHCACYKCNKGTYSDSVSASDPVADCLVCPSGTNTSVEAGYRACPCLADSSRTDRFGECTSCLGQEGIKCVGDFRKTLPGFHWAFATAAKLQEYKDFATNLGKSYDYDRDITFFNGTLPPVYKCPDKDACLGGIEAECASGTTGPLCAVCATGHFGLNGGCHECPTQAAAVASALAIVIIIVALTIITVRYNAVSLSSKLEALERRAEQAVLAGDSAAGGTSADATDGADDPWYKCSWLTLVSGQVLGTRWPRSPHVHGRTFCLRLRTRALYHWLGGWRRAPVQPFCSC